MERAYLKAINFDLNTKKMAQHFNHYTEGYAKLKSSFERQGFEHRQGSGYISKEKLNSQDVTLALKAIVKENLWLGECVKKIDVTNVGKQFDMMKVVEAVYLNEIEKTNYISPQLQAMYDNSPMQAKNTFNIKTQTLAKEKQDVME